MVSRTQYRRHIIEDEENDDLRNSSDGDSTRSIAGRRHNDASPEPAQQDFSPMDSSRSRQQSTSPPRKSKADVHRAGLKRRHIMSYDVSSVPTLNLPRQRSSAQDFSPSATTSRSSQGHLSVESQINKIEKTVNDTRELLLMFFNYCGYVPPIGKLTLIEKSMLEVQPTANDLSKFSADADEQATVSETMHRMRDDFLKSTYYVRGSDLYIWFQL